MEMTHKRIGPNALKSSPTGKICHSQSKDQAESESLLKLFEAAITNGILETLQIQDPSFDELARDYITDYKINEKKSLFRAEINVMHLEKYFKLYLANQISTSKFKGTFQQEKSKVPATGQSIANFRP